MPTFFAFNYQLLALLALALPLALRSRWQSLSIRRSVN
jgi:hypothetical protein